MSDKNTGGSAFPALEALDQDMRGCFTAYSASGMSLRDYFASKAPAMPDNFDRKNSAVEKVQVGSTGYKKIITVTEWETLAQHLARWSYAYADAMLAERAK